MLQSLDPRITRLNIAEGYSGTITKDYLDQLGTYEVFFQKKKGADYEHAGIVHAPDEEMAFIFAKEQFSRRFTCTGLWVVKTEDVKVTEYTDLEDNIYDRVMDKNVVNSTTGTSSNSGVSSLKTAATKKEQFEIFHLKKRGKQHVYAGPVLANNYEDALIAAKSQYDDSRPVLNVWVIKTSALLFSSEEDKDIWDTLAEKKYRDVTSYKAKGKLDQYKAQKAADH